MSSFTKNNTARTPFGRNEFRRSTKAEKWEGYTVAAAQQPYITIDGDLQKMLQPGTIMAKITSGIDAGKVGVFQAAGTDEQQTITKAGTWTSGNYTLNFGGGIVTAAIPMASNAAAIQAAVNLVVPSDWGVTISGGPLSTTPVVVVFNGEVGVNRALITVDASGIVGGGTATSAEDTAGSPGATDGRQTAANIVGINGTFLPWQLLEHDEQIAVLYDGTPVQAWCIEYNAAGAPIALSNTTRDAILALPQCKFIFK